MCRDVIYLITCTPPISRCGGDIEFGEVEAVNDYAAVRREFAKEVGLLVTKMVLDGIKNGNMSIKCGSRLVAEVDVKCENGEVNLSWKIPLPDSLT